MNKNLKNYEEDVNYRMLNAMFGHPDFAGYRHNIIALRERIHKQGYVGWYEETEIRKMFAKEYHKVKPPHKPIINI